VSDLEIKFQLKVKAAFINCKSNYYIIIIIDCQPFQHPLSLVLLPILSLCLQSQNQYQRLWSHKQYRIIKWVNDVRWINWNPF